MSIEAIVAGIMAVVLVAIAFRLARGTSSVIVENPAPLRLASPYRIHRLDAEGGIVSVWNLQDRGVVDAHITNEIEHGWAGELLDQNQQVLQTWTGEE